MPTSKARSFRPCAACKKLQRKSGPSFRSLLFNTPRECRVIYGLINKGILPLLNLVSIVYLLPVLVAATQWGLAPAVLCAFAVAAAADYFFYPPLYSFEIGDAQNLADLVIFLIIAVVTSHYTSRLKRKSDSLRRSRRELRG